MIVLNEIDIDSCGRHEDLAIEALEEKAALVLKYPWFKNKHFGKRGMDYVHGCISSSNRNKYWP